MNAGAGEELETLLTECIRLQLEGKEDSLSTLLEDHAPHAPALRRFMQSFRKIDASRALPLFPAQTPGQDPFLGRTFDDFHVIALLGKGALGKVYLCRQNSLDRLVALKILAPGLSPGEEVLQRFQKEGRILAKLNHRNIVSVHAVGNHPECGAYIAMQYVRGLPLSEAIDFLRSRNTSKTTAGDVLDFVEERIRRKNIPQDAPPSFTSALPPRKPLIPFLVETMRRTAEALSAAHRQGLVHRDIKPSNILLCADGNPVVVDFGLTLEREKNRLTVAGEIFGTPLYTPPECLREDSGAADARSDIYSLGVTFYEIIAGRPPFEGKNLYHTLKLIETRNAADPRKLNKAVTTDLAAILMKCLEKDPAHRYGSAAALCADLESLLNCMPVTARPRGPISRCAQRMRRNPAAPLAGAMAAVMIAAFMGIARVNALREKALLKEKMALLAHKIRELSLAGKHDEAAGELALAEKTTPGDPLLRLEEARLDVLSGKDLSEAEKTIDDLLDAGTGDRGDLLFIKARVRAKERIASLESRDAPLLGDLPRRLNGENPIPRELLSAAESALRGDPDDADLAIFLADNLMMEDRWARIVEVTAPFGESMSPSHALILAHRAAALFHTGRTQESLLLFSRLGRLQPQKAASCADEAIVLAKLGKREEALHRLEEALQRSPRNPRWLERMADLALETGRPGKTLLHLRQLAEIRPKDASIHEKMGRLLAAEGRTPEARDAFLLAFRLQPTNALPAYAAAEMSRKLGDHETAAALLEKTLTLDPQNPAYMKAIGETKGALGDWDAAVFHLKRASERSPSDAETKLSLLRALLKTGDQAAFRLESLAHLAEAPPIKDPEGRMSLKIPPLWEKVLDDKIRKIYAYQSPDKRATIVIRIFQNPRRIPLSGAVGHILNHIKGDAILLRSWEGTLGRRKTHGKDLKIIGEGETLRSRVFLVEDREEIVAFSAFCPEEDESDFRGFFEASLQSFRVLPE